MVNTLTAKVSELIDILSWRSVGATPLPSLLRKRAHLESKKYFLELSSKKGDSLLQRVASG
jgi:hypothetical protein